MFLYRFPPRIVAVAETSQRYLVLRGADGNKIDVNTSSVNHANYDPRGWDMESVGTFRSGM